MNSNIQIFENNDFGQIRVVERGGKPWFVAADVCTYFGVTNRNRVMRVVDVEDKGSTQIGTRGGVQTVTIVNEPGLYSILFALQPAKVRGVSEDYIAERQKKIRDFKRWITHDALSSIRKTGIYSNRESDICVTDNPIARAQRWIEETQERLAVPSTREWGTHVTPIFSKLI